jgi:TetR/AcrR family transcriptional repressor of nem operon
MARPREFDIDEALDRAMNVFWAKGYEAASLQDLLEAMGIARGSLYKAFKDKHSIYLAALDRYDRTVVQAAVDMLSNPKAGDGVGRVRRFLEAPHDAVARRNDRRGCFLCNAAVDQAPADPTIRAQVIAMMKRLERAIGIALNESKRATRWSAQRRAEVALLLTNAYIGLRVLARAGYAASELAGIVDATLRNCGLAAARRT